MNLLQQLLCCSPFIDTQEVSQSFQNLIRGGIKEKQKIRSLTSFPVIERGEQAYYLLIVLFAIRASLRLSV